MKSAQFPAIGSAVARYHTKGEDLLVDADGDSNQYLSDIQHGEREVFVDDMLISGAFIGEVDELRNHYDVRSAYARKFGTALARKTDTQLLTLVVKGAQSGAANPLTSAEMPAGLVTTDADSDTSGSSLLDSIEAHAEAMDNNNVPEEGRYCFVKPAQYNNLVKQDKLIDADFVGGSNGAFPAGTVKQAWGINIVKSNQVPTTNITSTAGQRGTTYIHDCSNTTAVLFQTDDIASVSLADVQTEMEYLIERQGHLLLAKKMVGHDWLATRSLGQIQTA